MTDPNERFASAKKRGCRILGIEFFGGTSREAVDEISRAGGLLVAPAAPSMVTLLHDEDYRRALLAANLAIADSGLMVLLWKFFTGERPRISGLEHVKRLLEHEPVRQPGAAMWVVPTETARGRTIRFLRSIGIPASDEDAYVAPKYARPVEDTALLRIVEQRRPSHIVIAVGGGVQDKLGLYLMERLDYRPAIHCIGAALGFLAGDQVKIPDWADRFYFGWLLRVIAQPGALGLRYAGGVRLLYLVARYRDRLPPLKPRA